MLVMTNRQQHHRGSRLLRVTAVVALSALLATGCGTRADDAEIVAGAGGGPADLPPAVLDRVRAALGGVPGAPVASTAPGAPGAPAAARESGSGQLPTAPVGKPGKSPGTGGQPATPANQAAPKGADTAIAARPAACTTVGTPIPIGQVGSFSGVAGPITASARTALAVWAKHINAQGGLACHPVEIFVADDGADATRAASAVAQLVNDRKVVALVATFSSLSMTGLIDGVEKAKIPVVGGDLLALEWNSHPLLFPQGAGLEGQAGGAIQQLVSQGKTKLGLLYCVEASACTTGAKIIPERAKAFGAEIVYSTPVSLTQTDFTAQCQNAKNAGVQALGVAVDGSSIGRVARSCAALGYFPPLISNGLVISPAQAEDPGIRKNTLFTASSNAPWMRTDTPGQKEYAAALAQYAPGLETDGASMATWSAATLFAAAISKLGDDAIGRPITTADVFTGLGRIKNETLGGLAPPITFSPNQKFAPLSRCVYFELLTVEGWTAPLGSQPLCSKK
ncbi:MAG: ABC transporter substrate-binding protein [Sporichthyaceae bacterium]